MLLDILNEKKLKSTFFVTGIQIRDHSDILKTEYQAGHEIASHTWSHRALTSLTNLEIIAELEYTSLAIEIVTGHRPRFFRPPFGDIDNRVRAIAKAMGLLPILWNFDTGNKFQLH